MLSRRSVAQSLFKITGVVGKRSCHLACSLGLHRLNFALLLKASTVGALFVYLSSSYAVGTATLWITGPVAVQEGGTASYAAWLTQSDGGIQKVNANWTGGAPGSIGASTGVLTVNPGAIALRSNTTISASFSDPVLTSGQTLNASYAVMIQDGQERWVRTGSPGRGGDVRGILAFGNPTVLLAPDYGSGIYKSTDGGSSWAPTFGLGNSRVREVAWLAGPNVLLAATETGGIYRSVDGGSTWTPSSTGLTCAFARSIGVVGASAPDPNIAYAGTSCGLFRSTDAGLTWSAVQLGVTPTQVLPDPDAAAIGVVYVATTFGIYKGSHGSTTFSTLGGGVLPVGNVNSIYLAGNGVVLAAIEDWGLYRSTDSGATWSFGFAKASFGTFLAAGGAIYLSAEGPGFIKSIDSGATWTPVLISRTQMPSRRPVGPYVDPNSENTWYMATAGGVYKSTDGGANWYAINNGLPEGYVLATLTDPSDPNIVFASADGVYKSTDGGNTWSPSGNGIVGTTGLYPGAFSGGAAGGSMVRTGDTLYVATANHGIFKSTDSGDSWRPINNGLIDAYGIGQGPLLFSDPTNAFTLYAVFTEIRVAFSSVGVFRSTDGGANWSQIYSNLTIVGGGLPRFLDVDPANGALYLATSNGIWRTMDAGGSWTLFESPAPIVIRSGSSIIFANCTPTRVRVDATTSPSTVYWSSSCADAFDNARTAAGIYRVSLLGGSTQLVSSEKVFDFRVIGNGGVPTIWVASRTPPSTLPSDPARTGTAGRIFKTNDDGATKIEVLAGLPPTFPRFIELNSAGTQILRLGTGGAGIFNYVPPDTTPPLAPAGVTATAVSSSQINVMWTVATDNVAVTQYKVYRDAVLLANINAPATSFGDTGLVPFTAYSYMVVACDAADNCSTQSIPASATTLGPPDTQAPSVPTGVTAAATNDSHINVSWSASTDNIGVAQYVVFRNAVLLATLNSATLSLNDTGLAASTSYSYTVAACDATGNCSAQSASAVATTQAAGFGSFTASLESFWNLLGNSLNLSLDVVSMFGNPSSPVTSVTSEVVSVWKWDTVSGTWAFYSPSLSAAQNESFAQSRGYLLLSTIGPGEGYWVNTLNPVILASQTGSLFSYNSVTYAALPPSWNLLATASGHTPSQFANLVSQLPPPTSGVNTSDTFVSLWAWDSVQQAWYFYSPLLENSGGLTEVKNYAASRGYLHFQDFNKKLSIGTGFWVNKSF